MKHTALQTAAIPTHASALLAGIRQALSGREPLCEAVDGATPAAVLVPLQYHDGDWHIALHIRSQHVGQHQGEIAFPGGKLERGDVDMLACALRETWEEMGIRPEDVDVLGPLDAILTRTNFLVWPIVGVVPYPYAYQVDEGEVAEVIEVPLSHLLSESASRREARLGLDGELVERVAYVHGEHLVFGATAWILAQLVELAAELAQELARAGGLVAARE